MRFFLLIVALVLFLLAGLSYVLDGVSLNEGALVAFGLASWVGSLVVPERFG